MGVVFLINETLKSAIWQGWLVEISWFFPYWHKFRKAGNYVDNYWVVVVKNAHDALVHGILQSAVSQQWFDELRSVFLHADAN